MSDAVLTLLKIGLLASLYLFFGWVLLVGFRQVRGPVLAGAAPVPAPTAGRSGFRGQVVVMEPAELRGSVMSIDDELLIGRAAACTLTLDDTYVSQQHARLVRRDRQYLVEDLGSTNGTFVNRERIVGPVVLHAGDRVQIGSTVLEFS